MSNYDYFFLNSLTSQQQQQQQQQQLLLRARVRLTSSTIFFNFLITFRGYSSTLYPQKISFNIKMHPKSLVFGEKWILQFSFTSTGTYTLTKKLANFRGFPHFTQTFFLSLLRFEWLKWIKDTYLKKTFLKTFHTPSVKNALCAFEQVLTNRQGLTFFPLSFYPFTLFQIKKPGINWNLKKFYFAKSIKEIF